MDLKICFRINIPEFTFWMHFRIFILEDFMNLKISFKMRILKCNFVFKCILNYIIQKISNLKIPYILYNQNVFVLIHYEMSIWNTFLLQKLENIKKLRCRSNIYVFIIVLMKDNLKLKSFMRCRKKKRGAARNSLLG